MADTEPGVYRERAYLVAYLATQYSAVIAYSDPDEPEWPVVTLDTTAGQMTWHISPEDRDLFAHVPQVAADDPRAAWDGHTTEEKYARLAYLTDMEDQEAAIAEMDQRAREADEMRAAADPRDLADYGKDLDDE